MKNLLQKAIVIPLILLIVVAGVVYKIKSKDPIAHTELQFPTKPVEVIRLKLLPFRVQALAYGNVSPSVILRAKAEVAGKISYIHPELKKGGTLAKDTLVMRIEPTTYEFSINQKKAALVGNQSTLTQLEVEEASTLKTLKIAKSNLSVGEKELNRLRNILKQNLVSRSAVDAEEQKVLQLRQQVVDLQGKLKSYESRKATGQAQIVQSQSQLEQSKDTLERTEIRLPFHARIGQVSVEEGEFINLGGTLFEALGTHSVEINAQLPIRQLSPLLIAANKGTKDLQTPDDFKAKLSTLNLDVYVKLVGFEASEPRWEAKLLRIAESVNTELDTIALVIGVDNPYSGIIPGKRPPLLKGMYTMVELYSPVHNALLIPRKALHEGRVYVANKNNKLEIHAVSILHKQGDLVVIDKGLNEGDKIIVNDVIPLMEGLPLSPIISEKDENHLAQLAIVIKEFAAEKSPHTFNREDSK